MKNKIKIAYMALLAITVWFGLALQFIISTEKYMADGRTFGGAITQILTFFTIQNNILVALALSLMLLAPSSAWGKFFSKLSVLAALAVYITIVGLIYQLILRKQYHLHGLFLLADNIFHIVCPILFVLFWLIFVAKGIIKWTRVFNWLIYPLLYFFYVMVRGALSGYYPYNFLDATKISYHQVFINFLLLLSVFIIVGAIFIALSRLLNRDKINTNPPGTVQ